MSAVQALIASKKENPRELRLPPAVLNDLREVLKANDREQRVKCRVSILAFAQHCQRVHKFAVSQGTLLKICRRDLKRAGWGQK